MTRRVEPPSDPFLAAHNFVGEQLTRARELRGLTKVELAQRIDKSPSAITQFEKGQISPDASTLAAMALATGVGVGFLCRPLDRPLVGIHDCQFRSLRSASQSMRRRAIRQGELAYELARLLEELGVVFPAAQVEGYQLTDQQGVHEAASAVRSSWGLGQGPIHEMLPLLESRGILVFELGDLDREVDAFSMHSGGRPVVWLSSSKPASRVHFDAAHELGHLVLHADTEPGDPILEREADAFASAFLLPQGVFERECPRHWDVNAFRALKRRWRVSLPALVYRARESGLMSPNTAKRAFIDINSRGWRGNEPDEWVLRRPSLLRQAVAAASVAYPLSKLAALMGLPEVLLRELVRSETTGFEA